jgi:hypothetical protein
MYTFLFILFAAVCAIVAFYATFIHPHQHSNTESIDKGEQKPKYSNTTTTPPSSSAQPRTHIVTPAHSAVNSNIAVIKTEVQELQHFCIKDKGYHVSVWPKDQGFQGLDYIEFNIAGITHGEHIDDHLGEFIAAMEPEPTNPYNSQAIKILASNGDRLGYVPKDMTREVRNFTSLPCKCYCYIGDNNGVYYSCCYIPQN